MEVVDDGVRRYRLVRVVDVRDCDVTGMSPQNVIRRRYSVVIEDDALNRLYERGDRTFANLLRFNESNCELDFRSLPRIVAEDREGLAIDDNTATHRAQNLG